MLEIKDEKLVALQSAIDEYLKSKKFFDSYNNSTDIKILVNGASATYSLNSVRSEDFAIKSNTDIEDIGAILEYIVADNKMKVYQAIGDCMSYATAS